MNSSSQLGFDALLASADQANRKRQVERETGHLPSTIAEALPFYRGLIESHHTAMLAADGAEAMRLKEEAYRLAKRLNGGERGVLADENSPGCVLEREAAAPAGAVPLWGQRGDFPITLGSMRVRIGMDGLFSICRFSIWPGLCAHAIDYDRPFLSETGFRSFLGIHADLVPGMTPETFAQAILTSFIERNLHGRLVRIRRERSPKPRAEEAEHTQRLPDGQLPPLPTHP